MISYPNASKGRSSFDLGYPKRDVTARQRLELRKFDQFKASLRQYCDIDLQKEMANFSKGRIYFTQLINRKLAFVMIYPINRISMIMKIV